MFLSYVFLKILFLKIISEYSNKNQIANEENI